MCDLATGALVVGTGAKILGTNQAADAAKKSGKYNANIHRNNAVIQRRLSKDALRRGDVDEANNRMRTGQVKSDQRARMLAGGGTLTGSNSEILDDTDVFGELDALTIRSNSRREAWGHDVNAAGMEQQAVLSEMGGNADAQATVLGGINSVASSWYNYSQ